MVLPCLRLYGNVNSYGIRTKCYKALDYLISSRNIWGGLAPPPQSIRNDLKKLSGERLTRISNRNAVGAIQLVLNFSHLNLAD